jgi:hypothetical protein
MLEDFILLNLTIISSAVSSPFFTFSTTVLNAKPSFGSKSIKRLRSALRRRGVILLKFVRRYFQSARLALPGFPEGIVSQLLCPKGTVRKCQSTQGHAAIRKLVRLPLKHGDRMNFL